MKDLFNVTYVITDRGINFNPKTEEVSVSKGKTVESSLTTLLNKYRHAMDLSKKFKFIITETVHCGWSN